MTLIIFLPLWFLMWLVHRWSVRKSVPRVEWPRELSMLGLEVLLAVYVINLGYGFEGTFTRLGDFNFVSSSLGTKNGPDKSLPDGGNRFRGSWLATLPVPLPKDYVLGIDLQKRDFEDYYEPSYLEGQFREKGWWYYYFYALAIKVPLGTWILFVLAATRGIWGRRKDQALTNPSDIASEVQQPIQNNLEKTGLRVGVPTFRDEFVLLCPAVVILAFVSSQTGFSEHMRYVLPAFPFMFVWIGRISPFLGLKHWLITFIVLAALAWSIISSLSVYPHSLSYFNELIGGPTGGPKYLIHSNVDWGQDLLFLKKWLDQHPEAQPLKLTYFGGFDPKYAGIDYATPENIPSAESVKSGQKKIPPSWYAISVNFVRGLPYFTYNGDGSMISLKQNALVVFQDIEPVAMAGYSIYIYHVTE